MKKSIAMITASIIAILGLASCGPANNVATNGNGNQNANSNHKTAQNWAGNQKIPNTTTRAS